MRNIRVLTTGLLAFALLAGCTSTATSSSDSAKDTISGTVNVAGSSALHGNRLKISQPQDE